MPAPNDGERVFRTSQVSLGYLLASLIAIGSYPFLSGRGRVAAFLVVSVGTLLPVALSRWRLRPTDRRPWTLLLTALIVLNVGNVGRRVPGEPAETASIVLDAAGYGLVLAAAFALILRRGRGDIGAIIDSILVSLALGGILLYAVVLPYRFGTRTGVAAQVDLLVIVFALTGVLGALVRLAQFERESLTALTLLMASLALALTGNVMIALSADPLLRTIAAMMLMVAYLGLGLFSLEPTAQRLMRGEPASREDALSTGRLVFLGVAVAMMPLLVGGRILHRGEVDGLLLIVGGLLVATLVMVRIGRLSAERTRAERALKYEATHDPLTRLPNRREFVARLDDELGKGIDLVILFLDLDGFKEINDRLGHAAGDQVLVEVAKRLRSVMRATDLVSRFGGDEFLILLTDASIDDVDAACDRIAQALARPVELAGDSVMINASIGAALPASRGDAEGLIRRADRAMYHAKKEDPAVEGVRVVVA